jgi:hypothetical protein
MRLRCINLILAFVKGCFNHEKCRTEFNMPQINHQCKKLFKRHVSDLVDVLQVTPRNILLFEFIYIAKIAIFLVMKEKV